MGAASGGVDETARERLAVYRDALLEWNERFNLTAVKDPDGVDRRLIGDALRLLPAIDGFGAARLVDVGTGAGLPGLVLKIARPDLDVTLIEATGKKVAFLRHAIAMLGLEGVEALHGRAEELGRDPRYRGRYDLATARAVAALPVLVELCLPFLRVGGRALFPKGPELGTEFAEGERAAALVGGRIESAEVLPIGAGEPVTRLVIAAKIRETPYRFPRRSGVPAKEPLGRV
ncbi:MAG TPA: 16S rRNA (guanine(527)-N(7))-methyltransferase RsmG [Thermomicrobiales bacterium]